MSRSRVLARLPDAVLRGIDYPGGYSQATHHHAWSSVTLVLAGGLEERVGRRHEIGRPLSVVVKPAGTEHADRFGADGVRSLQLAMRPDVLESEDGTAWRWFHAGGAAQAFLGLVQAARTEPRDAAGFEGSVFDLLARLQSAAAPRPAPSSPPAWVREVAQEVDDTYATGPSVRALAAGAGVHPVSLARRFRRHYGMSVTERVTLRRVQRAAGLLVATDAPLSRVAHDAGFTDQSHLSRVFRHATGLTPGGYRAISRA